MSLSATPVGDTCRCEQCGLVGTTGLLFYTSHVDGAVICWACDTNPDAVCSYDVCVIKGAQAKPC